jgi:large subunit ribosomal protein L9
LLKDVALTFSRKAGENDQLFGSVTASDIVEALAAQGFQVDKRRIELAEPIKVVGQYEVTAKLVHGITATFKVNVTRQA